MNTKLMNKCLMANWIWKLYAGEQGLLADILRNKYLRGKDLLVDGHTYGSQFWKAIQKVKDGFRLGAKHLLGNGTSIRLWLDWWIGPSPLYESFPEIFSITLEPKATIADSL